MKKLLKRDEHIRTYTGKKFHLFNPTEDEVDIVDIAHSQSMQGRFNGHTCCFYSIASHSLIGAKLIAKEFKKDFIGHDFAEAYTGDCVTPIKRRNKAFRVMEKKIEAIISKKFNFSNPLPPEIKEMDNLMFRMESAYLMGNKHIPNEKFPMTKKEFMNEINKSHKQIEKELIRTFNRLNK